MRIFFLNPPYLFKISRASRWPEVTKSGTLYYPFWLAYACGYNEKKGHQVFLYDAVAKGSTRADVVKKIKQFNPDLIVMEMSTPVINYDFETISYLKSQGVTAKIIATGPHPSVLPEETLRANKNLDFVAIGEYDLTIDDLARNLTNPEKVKGIAYLDKGFFKQTPVREPLIDLDELPFVSQVYRKFLDLNDYRYSLARHPMLQIFSSRGCPNLCVFCDLPQAFSGRRQRCRSKENFVSELEYIQKEMPEVKEIFIEDDTFTTNPKAVEEICDLIVEKGLKLVWSANVRANVPLETMLKMKKAGCRLLVVGYESGNDEVLKKIRKGITTENQKHFAENAHKAKLKVFGCFMVGLPGDTKETMEETFKAAKALKPDMAFFQQAVPFPGTELYDWAKEHGYITAKSYSDWLNQSGQLDTIVSYPHLHAKEIEATRDRFMAKFYSSPAYIWQTFVKNLSPREAGRVVKGFCSYLKYRFTRKEKNKNN